MQWLAIRVPPTKLDTKIVQQTILVSLIWIISFYNLHGLKEYFRKSEVVKIQNFSLFSISRGVIKKRRKMGKTPLDPLQFSQFVSWCLAWNYDRLFSDSFYVWFILRWHYFTRCSKIISNEHSPPFSQEHQQTWRHIQNPCDEKSVGVPSGWVLSENAL